jgi:hypothetical protein
MRTHIGLAMLGALCGCVEPALDGADGNERERRQACTAIDNRSLVETDPAIVNDARFSLGRVFEQIRATTPSGFEVPTAPAMFTQLYRAFSGCGAEQDQRGYGLKCRPAEAVLAEHDPFTDALEGLHFQPVAVLGRYDMANEKRGTCGESRIVYWKDRGPTTGKAGFIVELETPPVRGASGKLTCAPIAQFWASLSAEPEADVRAQRLESFLFDGLPGMAFAPASAQGAGWSGAGQLRSNNFVDNVQWNMREVRWGGSCSAGAGCRAGFVLVDTKNSPSEKLFAGTHPDSAAFAHWFLSKSVPRLAKATSANELSLGNPSEFNAYESISQPFADDPTSVLYRQAASVHLRGAIATKLAELRSSLTVDNILDRATAVTCAGCHRISRNADLGGGLVFPPPMGFVHVGEGGELSAAMLDHFLPRRRQILQDAVCGRGEAPAEGETLAGHGLGEPN